MMLCGPIRKSVFRRSVYWFRLIEISVSPSCPRPMKKALILHGNRNASSCEASLWTMRKSGAGRLPPAMLMSSPSEKLAIGAVFGCCLLSIGSKLDDKNKNIMLYSARKVGK